MFKKIAIALAGLAVLAASALIFLRDEPRSPDQPENIAADYESLLAKAEALKSAAGSDCADKKGINSQIESLEKELASLEARKKDWLDNVPELPDVEPEIISSDDPRGRPGSDVPELSSDVPPLPDISPESIIVEEVPGSQVPELTPDVPPLPDIEVEVVDNEFIPELPEIKPGRPGSEAPELSSDAPPLPEISDADIIDPNESIYRIDESGRKIKEILESLKLLCQEEAQAAVQKKPISDKCSDACQRYKACAAYTEDATPTDIQDAFDTCMEECGSWPREMVKCINSYEIKAPNDCVEFLNCHLPQFYEGKYLE